MTSARARRAPVRRVVGAALAAALLVAFPASARAQTQEPPPTGAGNISEAATRRVFDHLRGLQVEGCVFEGVYARSTSMDAAWSRDGAKLPPAVITPRACARGAGTAARCYDVSVPEGLEQACPAAARGLREIVEPTASRPLPAPVVENETPEAIRDVTLMAFAASLALALAAAVRAAIRRPRLPWKWVSSGAALFVVALALRWIVRPSMANWYAEVVSPQGALPWARFGPGSVVFQQALRAILPWTDTTLFAANAVIGAAAIPLLVALLRERRAGWYTATAAGVVLALMPLHVRISASASDHVLASTLAIAAMLAWTRGSRRADPLWQATALALIPAVALTRADSLPVLAAIPLWAWFRDPGERGVGPARAWLSLAAYGAMLVGTALLVYHGVVIPSHHPSPDASDWLAASRNVVSQYAQLGFAEPAWIAPLSVILAPIGLAGLAHTRRWGLIAAVAATVLFGTIPLGRDMQCGPVCARYFLTPLAAFSVAAGFGFGWLLERWAAWRKHSLRIKTIGAMLLVLVTAQLKTGIRAYAERHTFQDEYDFLRESLAKLPDKCRVYQVPVRQDAFGMDLDCCVDMPRSPLALAHPGLGLVALPESGFPEGEAGGCVAYYEGAACAISLEDPVPPRLHHARALLRDQCDKPRVSKGLRLVAEGEVSGRAMHQLFGARRPRVRLWIREQ